ncbi:hypothetical protein GCM10027590_45500 [Nocardiopsis nanhaiensis]
MNPARTDPTRSSAARSNTARSNPAHTTCEPGYPSGPAARLALGIRTRPGTRRTARPLPLGAYQPKDPVVSRTERKVADRETA